MDLSFIPGSGARRRCSGSYLAPHQLYATQFERTHDALKKKATGAGQVESRNVLLLHERWGRTRKINAVALPAACLLFRP